MTKEPLPAKRGPGRPAHRATAASRRAISVMVAAGMRHSDIAAAQGISLPTLAKNYRFELDTAKTKIDAEVVGAHLQQVKYGNFPAIKWWEQSRMGWRGEEPEPRAPDADMRVTIELVGEPAARPATIDHEPDDRDQLRKNVQLIG
jgi:hypothetical protein